MNHSVTPASLVPDGLAPKGLASDGLACGGPAPCGLRQELAVPAPDLRRINAHPDHWYPLAWSRELKRGGTLAVSFAGDPIVLVRPKNGPVFALEDRCAHRQVPLSKGTVDGCAVRCCYHGWAYEASGKCIDVPYLRDRLPNGVKAYPCREVEGLILVFPGDASLAEATVLPGLGSLANPKYKTRRFGRVVGCHYSFMHENLMDMNHQFMHSKQMGQMKPRVLGQGRGDGWVEAKYSFKRTGGKQPLGEAVIFGERRSGQQNTAERDVMTIRTEYPYQTLRIQSEGEDPVMDLWIVYVPLDRAQKTNRVFGLLSVRKPKLPGILNVAWPLLVMFTERIFREDREIVELEQAAFDEVGRDRNQEVFPVIRSLRSLLVACGVDSADASRTGSTVGSVHAA